MAPHTYITPFANVQAGIAGQDGFVETGSSGFNLAVAGQTTGSFRTELGGQIATSFQAGFVAPMTAMVRVGWAHEFANDNPGVSESFVAAPGSSFTVAGIAPLRDSAEIGAGVELPIINRVAAYVRYDGSFNGRDDANQVTGGLRVTW